MENGEIVNGEMVIGEMVIGEKNQAGVFAGSSPFFSFFFILLSFILKPHFLSSAAQNFDLNKLSLHVCRLPALQKCRTS